MTTTILLLILALGLAVASWHAGRLCLLGEQVNARRPRRYTRIA